MNPVRQLPRILSCAVSCVALSFAVLAAPPARADTDYTDHWSNPAQTGWGVALTQGTNAIYTEIFHYNAGHTPVWFGGTMNKISDGHYGGALYTVAGDYYGHLPYDPSVFSAVVAGSMEFIASDVNHAQLTYSINGVTVTTPLTRLALDAVSVAGPYFGTFVQTLSSDCNNGGPASIVYVPAQILVSQPTLPGGTVTITFIDASPPNATLYTMSGTATQFGKVLDIPVAAYANLSASFTPLHIYDLRRTANNGIEGRWKTIENNNDPCVDEGRFSGVFQ
jgi:hypothetical protein